MNKRRHQSVIRLEHPPTQTNAVSFRYQHYYLLGIDKNPLVRLKCPSVLHRVVVSLLHQDIVGAAQLSNKIAVLDGRTSAPNGVACYSMESDSGSVRFSIDSSDTRWVVDENALDWADIYFKTNFWPTDSYPKKVRPLINGNGTLTSAKIRRLKSLRNTKRTHDIVYWTKLWEPKSFEENELGQVQNLIEHQMRVFEALAQLPHTKSLRAILPARLKGASLTDCRRRLESAGVACQTGWAGVKSVDLWQALASARVVPLRPGNHLCISWRLVDLLCMGGCVVYDGVPFPQWSQPLNAGQHYINGGCRITPDYAPLNENQYDMLKDSITETLSNDRLRNQIGANAISYFDRFANPIAVTQYILSIIRPMKRESFVFTDTSQ